MFYIFHGDDELSKKETLGKLIGRLGDPAMLDLNTARFEGQVSFSELRQACDTVPFLAKVRLVIVENLLSSDLSKGYLNELVAYLPQMPETTRLVFLESKVLRGSHPVVKLAEQDERGYVKVFSRPEGAALTRWIAQRVAVKNGRISSRAAHLLATNVGNDLNVLENELEKLVLYAGDRQIEEGDVIRLSPYAAEVSIFDLVDAVGNRNQRKAALLLQQKLLEGTDPFFLFAMFVRQFRLLIQVKELAQEGERPSAIASALKLHNFVAEKLFRQAQQFSMAQLEQIYRHLLDVDVAVKTGRNDMETALNLLVAGLTADDAVS
ncbi:MAG: DNA polymerase III subunit delta [Chloroflexi bacterium]|nr:MAG: DNA polymerase III subunit delta [Chloroflexota bacterium]